jgi:hypothetical protein
MSKIISNGNSTSVMLGVSGIFTGTIEDVSKYISILITINSDVSSIIQIYFGANPSNMKLKAQYTYTANENKSINIKVTDRFFQIIYNNGLLSQTTFTMQTYYMERNMDGDVNVSFNNKALDLFGNLKISNPFTLLDITHIGNKNTLVMDELVSGAGATSTYSNASVIMNVTATSQTITRQSRIYAQYQPGKSLCIRMTGVINASSNATTTTSRIGYFDNNNGLFFEYSNGLMYIVERNNSVDTKIVQTSWNVDTLNGNGVSGVNIPFNYNIIYYIEFAFLGVGHVRFGFYYDGVLYIAHILQHTTLTYPYILSPNLPVRYQLSSTGGNGTLVCTCASVQSEGGYNLIGFPFSAGMTTTGKSVSTSGVNYMMSIRLASNQRKLVKLQSITILCSTSANSAFELYRCFAKTASPMAGTAFTAADTNSVVEYDITAAVGSFTPATANAILVYRGYFSSSVNIGLTDLSSTDGPLYLTSGIDTPTFTTDYYVLCVRNYPASPNTYYASMNWVEI